MVPLSGVATIVALGGPRLEGTAVLWGASELRRGVRLEAAGFFPLVAGGVLRDAGTVAFGTGMGGAGGHSEDVVKVTLGVVDRGLILRVGVRETVALGVLVTLTFGATVGGIA